MCDYSLYHLQSRPAKVGDELTSGHFGSSPYGTKGLFEAAQPNVAVCLIPGTEVAFERAPVEFFGIKFARKPAVATFRQIDKDQPCKHHDALEFAPGDVRLVHDLVEGQKMTVLQLPAVPKTKQEAKAQERVAIAG